MDGFINELNDLVPGCPQLSKKLDKVIVLKKTVDFLKNQKGNLNLHIYNKRKSKSYCVRIL